MKLLQLLACPECLTELSCEPKDVSANGEIIEGSLECANCRQTFPITEGIPRFVERENYAASFGYQWNRFKSEQIDTVNGTRLSEKRFYSETDWTKDWITGKWILDVGCGAGRFLDVVSKNDCDVVGVDLSNATDAARATLGGRRNVHLVQASVYVLPFRTGALDGCYCIGVIQHTPDPENAVRALPRVLKAGGRIAVTIYERKPWTFWNAKYLVRPVTKRLAQRKLLVTIKGLMPILFPVTEVAFRVPYLKRFFHFAIPVANYVEEPELSMRQRYNWAILDTFDMLAPQYDQPQTQKKVESVLGNEGIIEIKRLIPEALNLVGRKGI
ncbi:MAG: methyltransferase domain-containing protein [Pyrinomonadaceae bacterium]